MATRDMSDKEFRAALARHGITGYSNGPLGRMYETKGGGFGGGSCGYHKTRRAELAYVLRRLEDNQRAQAEYDKQREAA